MHSSLSIGLDVTLAVALIIVSLGMVKVCTEAYNNLYHRTNLAEINADKAEFVLYDGALNTDEIINFIVTNGTRFEYVYMDGTDTYITANTSDTMCKVLYNIGVTDARNVSKGSLPLVSFELINFFTQSFIDEDNFSMYGVTSEGVVKNIKEAGVCRVIVIERMW